MSDPVSILIPLHRSERFVDVVVGNVDRLSATCEVAVSDPEDDAVLDHVRARVREPDRVRWFGPRPLEPGWVSHYNDLLATVETDSFLWLPHDDEIDLDYVRRCRAALGAGVIAATGVVEPIEGHGTWSPVIPPMHESVTSERGTYTCRANELLFEWNLGIPMRSVFSTERVRPILDTDDASTFADVVWCYGLGLDGEIVEVADARYHKRFYAESTHAAWTRHLHPTALPHLVREVRRRPDIPHSVAIIDELIRGSTTAGGRALRELQRQIGEIQGTHDVLTADHGRAHAELDRLRRHIVDLEAALDLARGEHRSTEARADDLEEQLLAIRGSRTWRLRRALLRSRRRRN